MGLNQWRRYFARSHRSTEQIIHLIEYAPHCLHLTAVKIHFGLGTILIAIS